MKMNPFIGNVVSALTMAWKQRYINISDDQWEQLHWEFFNGCSLVWKYPVQTAAFLIWAPRLFKILSFFYPLLICTILLLLVIFTIGPQLERMKADSDLQWVRFKEAATISCEDDFCSSWAGQQPYGQLTMARGVNRQEANNADDWVGWAESPHGYHQSIDQFKNCIEKNDIKFDFEVTDEEQEAQLGVSSKSIILGKVRELMERLIDELGGRVELDALNALESITQVLIESTGKDDEKYGKNCLIYAMGETENDLLDNQPFLKRDYVGDCEFISRPVCVDSENLDHVPSEHIKAPKTDQKPGKNVGSFAMGEAQHKLLDHGKFPKTSYVGDSEFITRQVTAASLNAQSLEHGQEDSNASRKQGKLYKLFISDDELSCNGNIQIIDNARDSESITRSGTSIVISKEQRQYPVPESLDEDSCSTMTSSISLAPEKDYTSVHSVGDNISGPADGGRSPLVQDKHQKTEGLSVGQQHESTTCRSLLLGVSKDEFRCMNELRELGDDFGQKASVGDVNHRNQTHNNKLNKDQHDHCQSRNLYAKLAEDSPRYSRSELSSPTWFPEHKNKQHYVMAGKLRSFPSGPITYVKKPQLVSSPVMLLGTQDMDLLWEEYNDAPSQVPETSSKGHASEFDGDISEMVDSDTESSPVCCLQALKFKGRLPLKKPNLKKISKALKKLGLMQHFRGRKTA